MSDEQLYLVIGIPVLVNLLGFWVTNMRINDIIRRLNIIDKVSRDLGKMIMHTDLDRVRGKPGLDK